MYIKIIALYNYRPIFIKESFHYERISGWNRTELATSYWAQWRGALCHILHTRRWHRTVNWHWEQPDPLQLDRTWEEQSVHQHCSAGCQLSWELREECSNSTLQPHTTLWVMHGEQFVLRMSTLYIRSKMNYIQQAQQAMSCCMCVVCWLHGHIYTVHTVDIGYNIVTQLAV